MARAPIPTPVVRVYNGNDRDNVYTGTEGVDEIYGNGGNDTLAGGSGNDRIDGGRGDDRLDGGAGDDQLIGGEGIDTADYSAATSTVAVDLLTGFGTGSQVGTDTLSGIEDVIGGSGDDTINGDAGANRLRGGAGNDTLIGGAGNDVVDGGDGGDIIYEGDGANDVIDGGTGYDTLVLGTFTTNGSRIVRANDGTFAITSTDVSQGAMGTGSGIERIIGSAAADNIQNFSDVRAGNGNDLVMGSSANDTLYGEVGDDQISGDAGDDLIDGGIDNDNLSGEAGNDTIRGGDGDDNLVGGAGADALFGGAGNDRLIDSSAENDTLDGGEGNDLITSGAGDDTLMGGGGVDTVDYSAAQSGVTIDIITGQASGLDVGSDTLSGIENAIGGAGNDDFRMAAFRGSGAFDGRGGNDRLTLFGVTSLNVTALATNTINSATPTLDALFSYDGQTVTTDNTEHAVINTSIFNASNVVVSGDFSGTALTGSLVVAGADPADVLDARGLTSALRLELYGNGGDDIFRFAVTGANDLFNGYTGIDTADYSAATSSITVNLGTGTATGKQIGTDTLSEVENVIGGSGDDILTGSPLANRLDGGAGNDIIIGGAGNDMIIGGGGSDTADYSGAQSGVTINIITGQAEGLDVGADTLSGIESGIGGAGDDSLWMAAFRGSGTFDGRGGNDRLTLFGVTSLNVTALATNTINSATPTLDALFSYDGQILATDNTENALIYTGTSNASNVVVSGDFSGTALTGSLVVAGADPADVLDARGLTSALRLELYGNGGDDIFRFAVTGANDLFNGYTGIDTADYSAATSSITANLGTGTATGSQIGTDTLSEVENVIGGSGDDILNGSAVANRLEGGAGNDTIIGGAGDDLLAGGSGDDTFIIAGADKDTIDGGTGFNTLDLSANTVRMNISSEGQTVRGNYNYQTDSFTATSINKIVGSGQDDGFSMSSFTTSLTIEGRGGTDVIIGGSADDFLDGGTGTDFLVGNGGSDTLTGGAGADYFQYDARSAGQDRITDFSTAEGDKITIQGNFDSDPNTAGDQGWVYSGSSYRADLSDLGQFVVSANGDGTFTWSVYRAGSTAAYLQTTVNQNLALSDFQGVNGGSVTAAPPPGPTEGDDNLLGTPGNDIIDLLGGNDTYDGLGGSDEINGGAGNDTIKGGAGEDTMVFSSGLDTFDGGSQYDILDFNGADITKGGIGTLAPSGEWFVLGQTSADQVSFKNVERINGSKADDTINLAGLTTNIAIFGGLGNDQLTGGSGHDAVWGGLGNDVIWDGGGSDGTNGEAGTDTYVYASGQDNFDGGDDFDTVDFSGLSAASGGLTTLAPIANYVVLGQSSANYLMFRNVEKVIATSGNDTINLGALTTAVTIEGGVGNDTITGGAGNDVLVGGSGDDMLDGRSGNDIADGGEGNDVIYWSGALTTGEVKSFVGGLGFDTLDLSGLTNSTGFTIRPGALYDGMRSGSLSSFEVIIGSPASDNIDFSNWTGGNLNLQGGDGNDGIYGGNGNDTLIGGLGYDILSGGLGIDTLTGGNGPDVFAISPMELVGDIITDFSVADSDRLTFGGLDPEPATPGAQFGEVWYFWNGSYRSDLSDKGQIILAANGNHYTLSFYQAGDADVDMVVQINTSITAAEFSHSVVAAPPGPTQGDDNLLGTSSNDTIDLLGGNDTYDGQAGNDSIRGGSGFDRITGGAGDDTIFGGLSLDSLSGGAGADRFVYTSFAESDQNNRDGILDFNLADGDTIDFSALGQFTFVGETYQPGVGAQATLTYRPFAGDTILTLYSDGDSVADLEIYLVGQHLTPDGILGISSTYPIP